MARSDAGHGFPFSRALIPTYPVKQKIITYLEGPRNLAEGIALVLAHSRNLPLIRTLQRRRQDSTYAGEVFEELRKMAGLTPFAFAHMKRYAKRPPEEETKTNGSHVTILGIDECPHDVAPPGVETQQRGFTPTGLVRGYLLVPSLSNTPQPVSDTLQKMISFRKRFPFLNDPKCPDVLKVLVADMFSAYGKMRDAHQQLTQVPDDKMAPELTETVLDNFLEDRAIMAELEYYRDNGQLLGKHPKVAAQGKPDEISSMSDFDLAKAMKNAMSNVSKASLAIQRNPDKVEKNKARLAKWTARKEAIQAEIDRRSNSN